MRHMLAILLLFPLAFAPAVAQQIDSVQITPGAAPNAYTFTVSVSATNAGAGPCGVALNFGDGSSARKAAKVGAPAVFSHAYKAPGNYPVIAAGETLNGFWGPVAECSQQQPKLAWIVDPKTSEDGSLDVLILARTRGSRGTFITNLDGSFRLADPKARVCSTTRFLQNLIGGPASRNTEDEIESIAQSGQLGLLIAGQLYQQAGADNMPAVAGEYIDQFLKKAGHAGTPKDRCPPRDDLNAATQADLVAVPRALLPKLAQVPAFTSFQQYAVVSTLPFKDAQRAATDIKKQQQESSAALAGTTEELRALAKAESRAKVGSLVLSNDRSSGRAPTVCSVAYKGDEGAAIQGYRSLDADMLLPDTKDRFAREGQSLAPQQGRNAFDKVFPTINDAFLELSKALQVCNVFIDYPANLIALESGLQREQARRFSSTPGVLLDADAARERLATRRGYASYADNQFARAIDADLGNLKTLKAASISSMADYDRVVAEMQQSQHSTGRELSTVLTYLRDVDDAKTRKVSVIAQRDYRLAEAKKAQAEAEARRRKDREDFVRDNPFEAVLSCGFRGQHMNIAACFAGGSHSADTELEVRTGSHYALYKSWELNRAGNEERGTGLIIPLKANFEIKAQNCSDSLTLTLKIRETATGREVFVKSAAQYGMVSTRR